MKGHNSAWPSALRELSEAFHAEYQIDIIAQVSRLQQDGLDMRSKKDKKATAVIMVVSGCLSFYGKEVIFI